SAAGESRGMGSRPATAAASHSAHAGSLARTRARCELPPSSARRAMRSSRPSAGTTRSASGRSATRATASLGSAANAASSARSAASSTRDPALRPPTALDAGPSGGSLKLFPRARAASASRGAPARLLARAPEPLELRERALRERELLVGAAQAASGRRGKRGKDAVVGVDRLEVAASGLGHVPDQRSERGRARGNDRIQAVREARRVDARKPARARRLEVAFDPDELPGEQEVGARSRLQRGAEERGRLDERVAVEASEADELGALETRDGPEDPALLAVGHLRLEPDHVEERRVAVVLAELDDRVRLPAGARVDEADRLERPERERVAAAPRHLLDRQAALEVHAALEVARRHLLRREHLGDEALV